ncbi:MAG TPA: hypothetical protein P5099_03915 [Candidatus Moranbacteria bacterium]|nr:hypothetical protein [Candidatus Moranbacteria bacterium]HSA08489.1 hypothetical protein [Candidatus Moranbacteria bacterium]
MQKEEIDAKNGNRSMMVPVLPRGKSRISISGMWFKEPKGKTIYLISLINFFFSLIFWER